MSPAGSAAITSNGLGPAGGARATQSAKRPCDWGTKPIGGMSYRHSPFPKAYRSCPLPVSPLRRSEEHTSGLQSLMRTSYAVFCLKKKPLKILKHKTTYRETDENK